MLTAICLEAKARIDIADTITQNIQAQ